ncbi:glycoside hydrolase [Westerdykella ornata]|uniref:Probable beta-glucosidase btgE n=1 Tax=Westerdykella ornata TaxID=318751 RepID=A0A6A6JX63_WESOR|nr:glycoside hydrolase [Westerdykella ornata]KAF2281210.1 glycoside hydrolase [Westerdykella ornata]
MKGAIAAASVALVASAAAAAHNNHAAFHLRRHATPEVCTVYTTIYVSPTEVPTPVVNTTVLVSPTPVVETSSSSTCTEKETPAPAPPAEYPAQSPPAPAPEPPKETYVAGPPPPPPAEQPKPSKPAQEQPKPSKPAQEQPKPSSPATPPPSYHGGGRIVTNGNKWAMTYTPYTRDGQCRSPAQVKEDIANIARLGFTTIRSYSTDCGVFENVVPECQKHGIKVIYGIFLEGGGSGGRGAFSSYANNQLNEIIQKAPKDSVAMIIVGNEALFNNYATPQELASYITHVKQQLTGAGFPSDIAVTTTEPVGTWEQKGKALCGAIDVFAVQIHPYFTSSVSASEAGSFAAQQLEQAAKVCPEAASRGKYITEIGWPKAGRANGAAQPGVEQQKTAIKDILGKVGKESILFSYQDDYWKNPGEYGVEQSFGCSEALA